MDRAWAFLRLDQDKCDLCRTCVQVCRSGALGIVGQSLVLVRPEDCDCCGLCEDACAKGAISCEFEIVWAADSDVDPISSEGGQGG